MKQPLVLALGVLAAPISLAAHDAAGTPSRLRAAIVGGQSASIVLQAWCAGHGLPPLRTLRLGVTKPPGKAVRDALRAGPGEKVLYRRVRLACGAVALSEADNWYLPDRLTSDMNRQLETTDAPFGLVVRPLEFSRRTLGASRAPDPRHVLKVRALLVSGAGRPFSYVIENYDRLPTTEPGAEHAIVNR